MIRGLYTSAAGMVVEQSRQDITANNLANANTNGFKRDGAVIRSFPEMLLRRYNDFSKPQPQDLGVKNPVIGSLGTGAVLDEVMTYHDLGNLRTTENPLDLALGGEGYFVVSTPQGERYTRNGSFRINQENILVTSEGYPVMGERGPITVRGEKVSVDEKGAVYGDEELIDHLQVVTFADTKSLVKEGHSLYRSPEPPQAADWPQVQQGMVEGSNVNVISEMVNMITVMRAYEANQKAIQTQDGMLDKAVNEVGRV